MAKSKLWIPFSRILLRRLSPPPPLYAVSRICGSLLIQSSLTSESLSRSIYGDNYSSQSFFRESASTLDFKRRAFSSAPETEVRTRCWNCNTSAEEAPFLFCESCRSVQPVDHSADFFQIFALDGNYPIEEGSLEGKYKDWQKKLHPDLVHSKSEREKDYAAEQSARVIDAYRTLNNPLSRAIYMLKLKGVDVDEEQTISEPELLGEIMEIREAVEEAADTQSLNQIRHQMQEKLKHCAESFAKAFKNQNFEEAKTSIQKMTYYDRVNKEIVKRL